MRGAIVVTGLLLAGAGPLAAQDGYYLGNGGFGPEAGLVFKVGERTRVEPGVFLAFDRYHDSRDSSSYSGHYWDVGLAGRVLWIASPSAMVSPVGGLSLAVGKSWQSTESDENFGLPGTLHQESSASPWLMMGSAQAGVEVQVSEWAALSFEYALRVRYASGTIETHVSAPFLNQDRREGYHYTSVFNAFVWTVRLFRGGRAGSAGND